MSRFGPRLISLFAFLAVLVAAPAGAQENLDQGKTAAQLFASDCAICHKAPRGLAKAGAAGLDNFLRQHYTASRESAGAIAAYLRAAGNAPAAPARAVKRTGTGADKKPATDKPGEAKSAEPKPSETKPSETKPSEPSEAKPVEPKPSEPKPAEGSKSD